jgi:hypothetical protein
MRGALPRRDGGAMIRQNVAAGRRCARSRRGRDHDTGFDGVAGCDGAL